MAVITQSAFKVIHTEQAYKAYTTAYDASRQGKIHYIDGTTGYATRADASTVALTTGSSGKSSAIIGIAVSPALSTLANTSVTLMTEGDVFLGETALNALDIGAPVYLSDTLGALDTAAGTVSVQVGHVRATISADGVIQKYLHISTGHLALLGAVS